MRGVAAFGRHDVGYQRPLLLKGGGSTWTHEGSRAELNSDRGDLDARCPLECCHVSTRHRARRSTSSRSRSRRALYRLSKRALSPRREGGTRGVWHVSCAGAHRANATVRRPARFRWQSLRHSRSLTLSPMLSPAESLLGEACNVTVWVGPRRVPGDHRDQSAQQLLWLQRDARTAKSRGPAPL